ncbi:TPA: protein rep [Vibrio parahaemolyticus]|nr:protein rep [Vibrio parahaemolyticus]
MSKGSIRSGEAATLGRKTKSSSPSNSDSRKVRAERYELTRTARAIYAHQGAKSGLEYILNFHRTARCAYIAHDDVNVNVSYEHKKAFLSGVMACGSTHCCAVCASKIEERRRGEISRGVDYWYGLENKTVAMITLTFSHCLSDKLQVVLDKQKDALERLRRGKAWEKFKAVFGFDSLIRSLEVTWSERNGWHPHTHELWCLDKEVDRERLNDYLKAKFRAKRHGLRLDRLLSTEPQEVFKELLLERWEQCCERAGLMIKSDGKAVDLSVFRERSLDVKWNVSTADYIAKQDSSGHWGIDREMSKGSTKKGRKKGMHPFRFLAKFKETGNGDWSKLWLEYTKAIDGKSRIFWSPLLKKRVGIDEMTDEEIAAKQDDKAYVAYTIDRGEEWRRARNDVPVVLDAAEDGEDVKAAIETIELERDLDRRATADEYDESCDLRVDTTPEDEDQIFDDFKAKSEHVESLKALTSALYSKPVRSTDDSSMGARYGGRVRDFSVKPDPEVLRRQLWERYEITRWLERDA